MQGFLHSHDLIFEVKINGSGGSRDQDHSIQCKGPLRERTSGEEDQSPKRDFGEVRSGYIYTNDLPSVGYIILQDIQ